MPGPRPSKRQRSKSKKPASRNAGTRDSGNSDVWIRDLFQKMESCPDAESLNDRIVGPFVQALVEVCNARGYVLNIYGEHCNLAITPEHHAEALYRLIDAYLDEAGL